MDAEANESAQQVANGSARLEHSDSSESNETFGNLFADSNVQRSTAQPTDNSEENDKTRLLELGNSTILKAISRKKYAKEAKDLIARISNVNVCDDNMNTPLHHAAKLGKKDVVRALLAKNADVHVKDGDGCTPLKICASRGDVKCLKLILKKLLEKSPENMEDINLSLLEAAKKRSGTCVEELLKAGANLDISAILQLSNCAKILCNRFNNYIKQKKVDPAEHFFGIIFDYSALIPDDNNQTNRQMGAIELIVNAKKEIRDQLILHPLIESFIYFKWRKMCYFYCLHIVSYLVLNCLFTAFIATSIVPQNVTKIDQQIDQVTNSSTVNQQINFVANTWLLWICRILVLPFLIKEIVQVFNARLQYFQRLERTSEFIVLAIVAILLYVAIPLVQNGSGILHPLVLVSLLRWIRLTIMCGTVGKLFGTYSLMFYVVCKHFVKLLLAFTFLFVGFGSTFYFIFNNSPAVQDAGIIVLIISMMINALDYEEFFYGEKKAVTLPGTAHAIYALFLFLFCLVLLNLFIALAVNDTKDLEEKGRAYQLYRKATAVIAFEHFSTMKNPRLVTLLGLEKRKLELENRMKIDNKIKVDGNRQVLRPNTPKQVQNTNSANGAGSYTKVPIDEDKQELVKSNFYLPKDMFERALNISNTE